ncbi:MAG: serine/threonine protein kinase, partial [Candidatus Aminicenantes bacterium]|nr:serine/threonine protein kinase [Candidatus Aminicenantes bacterium]
KKFIRVQREINTSQKISDERVVKIFGIEYMNNTPFLIMEFIKGVNLKTFVNKKRFLKWAEFKPVFIEILNGIKSLHDKNIIHRDIKPSNIIITSDGKIKIIDFGLSKELGDTEKTSSLGEMIGSPKYMSPEQIKGVNLDHTSDIYQLGLILYYIITQETNEKSDSSTIEQLMERINSDPRKMYKFNSPVSRFLKFGIYKSLETEKEFRFTSIDEMINFFSLQRIPVLKITSDFIRKKKKTFFILMSMIVLITLSSLLYFKNSGIISDLQFDGSEIIVSNGFGSELYKKDFAPMSILNAVPIEINGDFRRLRLRVAKESYTNKREKIAAVFLTKKNLYKDIVRLSIKSEKFASKIVLLNNKGRILHHQNFLLENNFMKRSLFSGWMDFMDIRYSDINGDKKKEIIFTTYQNMSMYPSELCVLDKNDFHIILNPGHIEKYYFYNDKGNETRALIIGMSNPFCHLRFLCDLSIRDTSDIQLPPSLRENIVRSSSKFSYMIIPHKTEIVKNEWVDNGIISFKSQLDSRIFTLNKEWELSIRDIEGVKVYKDKPQEITDMIYLLTRAYQKKIEKKSYNNPFYEINDALKLDISNPVFLALINYFAGDLYLSSGGYSRAEKYFNISDSFLSKNIDLNQKMAELYFLSGQNKKLLREIEKNFSEYSKFFGLGNFGVKLFKIYVFLNSGNFRSASDLSGE